MTKNFKNDGRRFEKELEIICVKYAGANLMRLKKVEQPIKTFGPPGRQRVIHLENHFLDFIGTWNERGGRMVTFEAKSTIKPVLRIGSGGLSDSQMVNIHLWDHAGAVTFLLWECNGVCRFWNAEMIARQAGLARHLKFEAGLMVPKGVGFILYDFRSLLIKLQLNEKGQRAGRSSASELAADVARPDSLDRLVSRHGQNHTKPQ